MTAASVPTLTLAPASGDQLDEVMTVMHGAFDPCFGEAWSRAQCAGILPMSGVAMTLARDDARPLGFTLSRSVAEEAELLLIAVVPEARRTGVGSALMQHFIDRSSEIGLTRLHLEVRDGNPAVEMYGRHGFEVHGRRRDYYKGRDAQLTDALTMVRIIGDKTQSK